jgi:hypothetical protein
MVTEKDVLESFNKAGDALAMWCILYSKAYDAKSGKE